MLEVQGRRLKMPLFEGEDSDDWIFRVERYFAIIGMTDEDKLDAVTLCFEGAALSCF